MSGTQLAAELRRSRRDLPVIFMSGYTSGPAPGGQELPADAPLLRKPFETDQLLHTLHRILSPSGRPGQPAARSSAGGADPPNPPGPPPAEP
jgi:FixJ family two-component response regulator